MISYDCDICGKHRNSTDHGYTENNDRDICDSCMEEMGEVFGQMLNPDVIILPEGA